VHTPRFAENGRLIIDLADLSVWHGIHCLELFARARDFDYIIDARNGGLDLHVLLDRVTGQFISGQPFAQVTFYGQVVETILIPDSFM